MYVGKIRLTSYIMRYDRKCDNVTELPLSHLLFLIFEIGISNLTMELYNEQPPVYPTNPIVPPPHFPPHERCR